MEFAEAKTICKRQGAFSLGGGPVRSWKRDRYHTPYLRDRLLDQGILLDTIETATTWENLPTLYAHLNTCITHAIADTGSKALVLTHLSHVYRDGASLYFTLLAKSTRGRELAQWQAIKTAATDCLMQHGGALSHHHGVGYDHAAWLAQETSQTGVAALTAIKRTLDPQGIMNPAKVFAL
jgi:alkyldihydroxyacetonephosphate synthase